MLRSVYFSAWNIRAKGKEEEEDISERYHGRSSTVVVGSFPIFFRTNGRWKRKTKKRNKKNMKNILFIKSFNSAPYGIEMQFV